jgi:hypothetical protein
MTQDPRFRIQMTEKSVDFFFIFSPNNSGTTIMAQALHSMQPNAYLPPFGNNEGHSVPTVRRIMRSDPWSETNLDWCFVKKEWERYALDAGKSSFIDASPPNIIRTSEIMKEFQGAKCLFSISSPYSYVASCVYNYTRKAPDLKSIRHHFKSWLKKATIQIENMQKYPDIPFLKYEDFCAEPASLFALINRCGGDFSIDASSMRVAGKKNSKVTSVIDMTPMHLAFLGLKGTNIMKDLFLSNIREADFFGYRALDYAEINSILSSNPLLALEGLERRMIPRPQFSKSHKIKQKLLKKYKFLRKFGELI